MSQKIVGFGTPEEVKLLDLKLMALDESSSEKAAVYRVIWALPF
jgi:hypothetical protein